VISQSKNLLVIEIQEITLQIAPHHQEVRRGQDRGVDHVQDRIRKGNQGIDPGRKTVPFLHLGKENDLQIMHVFFAM